MATFYRKDVSCNDEKREGKIIKNVDIQLFMLTVLKSNR